MDNERCRVLIQLYGRKEVLSNSKCSMFAAILFATLQCWVQASLIHMSKQVEVLGGTHAGSSHVELAVSEAPTAQIYAAYLLGQRKAHSYWDLEAFTSDAYFVMSVLDGEIEFPSLYTVDYVKHTKKKSPRRKATDDDCLVVGFSRDHLKARDQPPVKKPDVFCPIDREYYENIIKRLESTQNQLKSVEVDPVPLEHDVQDLKRTEYLVKYCSRELPFMSVNLARRARALQTLRLPDDVEIPNTTHTWAYRLPPREKFVPPTTMSMRPKYDPKLQNELRKISRITTGESTYSASIGLLGKVVLDKTPYGDAREEPKYGRWRDSYPYTFQI